jgi:hypothetical protein
MNSEELELIELLQQSCETQLVPSSQLVEQRLLRFARHGAPIVRRRHLRRIAVLASTMVLGTAGTAAAALNGGIRIGGVELFLTESTVVSPNSTEPRATLTPGPSTSSDSEGANVTLPGSPTEWPGEPVTLEEARSRYKARIRLPKALKGPAAVFWLLPPSSGQVTAVWKSQKDLPKTDDPNVGLLFSQFRGRSSDQAVLTKGQTSSRAASRLESVTVGSSRGWFISGPKHVVMLNDESGRRAETARLAGNTLIWASGEFTYRLEGNFTKATALRLANSMR